MKKFEEKPSLEKTLVHFGVKGMKWGQRKSRGKQIVEARERHNSRIDRLQRLTMKADDAQSKKRRQDLLNEIHKIAKEGKESGDIDMGAKMTRGEKIGLLVLTGGLGNIVVKAAMKSDAKHAKNVLDEFGNLKMSDFD